MHIISLLLPPPRALAGDSTLAEYYAFCGMHHIFDKHSDASESITPIPATPPPSPHLNTHPVSRRLFFKKSLHLAPAVTSVRFANDDKTQLVCSSRDGTLSLFSLLSDPPSLQHTLRGHTAPINDFDWSVANDFIVSASSDGTCRLWEVAAGRCVREIRDSGVRVLSCRFHPQNNNLLVVSSCTQRVFGWYKGPLDFLGGFCEKYEFWMWFLMVFLHWLCVC